MSNRFVLVFLAIVAVFIGLVVINKDDSSESTVQAEPSSHIIGGSAENSVTLIEYADFECPACGAYHPVLNEVKEKYGDRLAFQFRHYPIGTFPNSMAAHRAAEAAGKQGKFFEMHDLIFENQQSWSSRVTQSPASLFEGYAESIGLDMEQYRNDLPTSELNGIIQADIALGREINATSTPTFVLNGVKLEENPRDIDGFSALIDEALAAAE